MHHGGNANDTFQRTNLTIGNRTLILDFLNLLTTIFASEYVRIVYKEIEYTLEDFIALDPNIYNLICTIAYYLHDNYRQNPGDGDFLKKSLNKIISKLILFDKTLNIHHKQFLCINYK